MGARRGKVGLERVGVLEGLGLPLKCEHGDSQVRAILAGPFGERIWGQLEFERGGSQGSPLVVGGGKKQ